MKIYVSHSRELDFVNELYKPIRESELNDQHEFFLPHENDWSVNFKEILKDLDLVVAEVSFPSTGEGIELGWAEMMDVPIVCIYKEGAKISGSLKYICKTFISYADSKDLIQKLAAHLAQ